ncbi:MAG: UDP-N-acetylglucosamine--N-acetylmuramyl-(pentapeptide) pyrophosphoryl-undecaprenol N-acetylglucosamine transferase, partial [Flavobacteriales bacterium]
MSTKLHSVVISGGGTGGHIYPALAIADEIKKRNPGCKIQFVGAKGRMEMDKVPQAGYSIEGLWITGIERKIFSKKNLSFPFKLISSLWKARKLIKKHQPQVAIGVGGFASGPLLYRASKKNIPTLIQEQNSFPGITNRILSKRVDAI